MRCSASIWAGLGSTYACDMNDAVDTATKRIIKDTLAAEIVNLHEIQQGGILWPRCFHLLGFFKGSRSAPGLDTPSEQVVDHMGANESGGSGNENVAVRTPKLIPIHCVFPNKFITLTMDLWLPCCIWDTIVKKLLNYHYPLIGPKNIFTFQDHVVIKDSSLIILPFDVGPWRGVSCWLRCMF